MKKVTVSLSLTGVVPSVCDAEAGDVHLEQLTVSMIGEVAVEGDLADSRVRVLSFAGKRVDPRSLDPDASL